MTQRKPPTEVRRMPPFVRSFAASAVALCSWVPTPEPNRRMVRRHGQQDETRSISVCGVSQTEPGRDPEGEAQIDGAQNAAQTRTNDETEPERSAQHAELLGSLLGGGDVGDVGRRN